MKATVEILVPWSRALDAARITAGKKPLGKEPSREWKLKMLRAQHSPVQAVVYRITLVDIPTFVSVHLVRHHVGITHWVVSQRPDRSASGASRHDLPQDAPVTHVMDANAQTVLAISRKRLCGQASKETREAWEQVRRAMSEIDPEMAMMMVPECVRCGFCPELKPCGYFQSVRCGLRRDDYVCAGTPEEQERGDWVPQ